jgi:hypothetical protein
MPTPQDIEEYLRQTGQNIQQVGQNAIQQNIDQPMARLQALQQVSGGPGSMPTAQSPQPAPIMGGGGGMGGPGAGTMDEMAAARQKQVDMYNAASAANAHENDEPDLSGYTNVPKSFPNIQQRVKTSMNAQNIANTMGNDDEDEDKHTGIIQTGTLGNY